MSEKLSAAQKMQIEMIKILSQGETTYSAMAKALNKTNKDMATACREIERKGVELSIYKEAGQLTTIMLLDPVDFAINTIKKKKVPVVKKRAKSKEYVSREQNEPLGHGWHTWAVITTERRMAFE